MGYTRKYWKGLRHNEESHLGCIFSCYLIQRQGVWHDHCQPGPDSWCKYQVDHAKQTSTYKPGPGLPTDIIKHVKPILVDLTKKELLNKCLHGMT